MGGCNEGRIGEKYFFWLIPVGRTHNQSTLPLLPSSPGEMRASREVVACVAHLSPLPKNQIYIWGGGTEVGNMCGDRTSAGEGAYQPEIQGGGQEQDAVWVALADVHGDLLVQVSEDLCLPVRLVHHVVPDHARLVLQMSCRTAHSPRFKGPMPEGHRKIPAFCSSSKNKRGGGETPTLTDRWISDKPGSRDLTLN